MHRRRVATATAAGISGGAFLLALVLVWFAPVLKGKAFTTVPTHETAIYPWAGVLPFNGDNYAQTDQADLNAPWQALMTRAVHRGSLPFWNDESFGGQPLYSNGSSGELYPPRIVTAATLSPTTAHTAMSILHVALAGLLAYALLLDLGLVVPAALLGAVAWMFGTFTLDWIHLEVHAPVFAWLPAGLFCVRRAVVGSSRWIALTGAVLALLLVGTHLPFALVTCAAVGAYGAALAVRSPLPGNRARTRAVARVVAAGAIGCGLASIVLVPTALMLRAAHRPSFGAGFLRFADLRYLFVPPPHGLGATAELSLHRAAFVGTLTVACAVVGLLVRRRGSGLGGALVVVSLLVAVEGPVSRLAVAAIPYFATFRRMARLLFVTDLGVAILGAVGLDWLLRRLRQAGAASLRWRVGVVVALAGVAATAAQLGVYGRNANPPFASASSVYPPTPLTRALAALPPSPTGWPHRVLPVRRDTTHAPMLYAGEHLVLGIDSLGGYDSVIPFRSNALSRLSMGESVASALRPAKRADVLPSWQLATGRFDVAPRLGVDVIVATPDVANDAAGSSRLAALGWTARYSGPDGAVLTRESPEAGPRVVTRSVAASSDADALRIFADPSFDARSSVVVEGIPATRPGAPGEVFAARRWFNSARMTVRSNGGWLVVPSNWDPGWRASVAGHDRRVHRVNFNQIGVRVPAGTIAVALHYRPPGLALGGVVSLCALASAVCLLVGPEFILSLRRHRWFSGGSGGVL